MPPESGQKSARFFHSDAAPHPQFLATPNLTGVQLITKLRAAKMALPVVMAAARLPVHDLAQNPSLQLAATLAKPFAIDVLRATVKIVSGAGGNLGPKPNVCVGIS